MAIKIAKGLVSKICSPYHKLWTCKLTNQRSHTMSFKTYQSSTSQLCVWQHYPHHQSVRTNRPVKVPLGWKFCVKFSMLIESTGAEWSKVGINLANQVKQAWEFSIIYNAKSCPPLKITSLWKPVSSLSPWQHPIIGWRHFPSPPNPFHFLVW